MVAKISVESLLKMYSCIYSDQLNSKLGALSLYLKVALSNPKSLSLIAVCNIIFMIFYIKVF